MAAKRVTLRDVATASGVSPATVSFVLNNIADQTISAATRQRVEHAAAELGYVPHAIARALREGSSRIVLLNATAVTGTSSLQSYIRGLDAELDAHGHLLLVQYGKTTSAALDTVVNAVSPRAVIDLTGLYQPGHDTAEDGGWVSGLAAHSAAQIRYLAQKHHTSIAMALPAPDDRPLLASSRLKFAIEVATNLGLAPLVSFTIAADATARRAALQLLLAEHPQVTAIAAFDDAVALRVLSSLRELGILSPQQIAVVGFDDTEFGALSTPTLTTVHIDAEAFGRLSARTVLGLETGDFTPAAAHVIARESA